MSRIYKFEEETFTAEVEVVNDPDPEKVNDGFGYLIECALKKGIEI